MSSDPVASPYGYTASQVALQNQTAQITGTTLYIFAGAILVAMLAIGKPRLGVPLLILVALIMLVRANHKATSGG